MGLEPRIKAPWRRWIEKLGITTSIVGPTGFVLYELIHAGAISSRSVEELIAWGPAAFIVGGCFVLADRWAPKLIAAQRDSVTAQQKLADAVADLVARGDRDQREAIGTMRYLVQRVERLDERHERLLEAIDRLAPAAGAS